MTQFNIKKAKSAYRILEADYDNYCFKTLFHGINGCRVIHRNKWYKAERKLSSDGSGKRKYVTGFHLLPDYDSCVKYARKFKKRDNRYIVEVKYIGDRRKEHSTSPVILADYMLLPADAIAVCLTLL